MKKRISMLMIVVALAVMAPAQPDPNEPEFVKGDVVVISANKTAQEIKKDVLEVITTEVNATQKPRADLEREKISLERTIAKAEARIVEVDKLLAVF